MKKMIYGFLLWFVALFGVMTVSPVALATDDSKGAGTETKDIWAAGFNDTTNDTPFLSGKGMLIAWADITTWSDLLDSIKKFINWMLGLLATIALVICLYAGFKMVTSAGDEGKYKEGIEMMKKAGIGLVVIGLAWMIVSVVMWLIGNLT